jgi:hypothetical protein
MTRVLKPEGEASPTFTKDQFLESKRFTPQQKDVLSALLKEGEEYSNDQVVTIVDEFHRKVVE